MKDISIITDDVFRSLVREIRASQDVRTRAMILEKMLQKDEFLSRKTICIVMDFDEEEMKNGDTV